MDQSSRIGLMCLAVAIFVASGCINWNERPSDGDGDADVTSDADEVADSTTIDDAEVASDGDQDVLADGDADSDIDTDGDVDGDGDSDADSDADAPDEASCAAAIECFIALCGSDDVCILLCLEELCTARYDAAITVLMCANDACVDLCQDPGEQACTECVLTRCSDEMDACEASSCM